jgi:alkanesulfonate monooxygenase SsuD/methylene tetrahydromethanopterin reductase-like flavin-dependent oxidoreductase (luciferase family)
VNAAPRVPSAAASGREAWGLSSPQLAISLGGSMHGEDWQRSLAWVDLAEELGLHSVWLPEMHFAPGVCSTPLLALAGFAARTRKLRLATTSVLLPIHHPLRVAEEVTALDRLSDGRVILGLGRGFRPQLFAAYGIDPATKRGRFDEALDLMLEAWSGRPVSAAGTPFEAPEDSHEPLPVLPHQRPHPPLAVAAFGRLGLTQAANRALPYIASPLESLDLVEENHHFHRENLPEGTDPDALVVPILRTVHAAKTDAEAARVLRGLEEESSAMPRGRTPKALARAAEAGIEERVVVGTRNEVADRLCAYRERIGVDLLIVRPQVSGATQDERAEALARLHGDVMPQVQ